MHCTYSEFNDIPNILHEWTHDSLFKFINFEKWKTFYENQAKQYDYPQKRVKVWQQRKKKTEV